MKVADQKSDQDDTGDRSHDSFGAGDVRIDRDVARIIRRIELPEVLRHEAFIERLAALRILLELAVVALETRSVVSIVALEAQQDAVAWKRN